MKKRWLISLIASALLVILTPILVSAAALSWNSAQYIDSNIGDVYNIQMAMSGSNVVAVWSESQVDNYHVYANNSTDGGATWQSSAQLLENSEGYNAHYPQVAVSGDHAVAVWYQNDGNNFRIYSNYSSDGGQTWQPTGQLIEDNSGGAGVSPQVAMSGSYAVAVWAQSDGSNNRVYSNYSTDYGQTWHTDQLIEDNSGIDAGEPQVSISGSNVVVVWYAFYNNAYRIYSNYSDDGGQTWHADQLIEDNSAYHGFFPQVAVSGDRAVAVWQQLDGISYRIWSNYSSNGGQTWAAAQMINNAGNDANYPQIALSGDNVVAVWYQGYNGIYRIFSNNSSDGGQTWQPAAQLIEDGEGYDAVNPQVALSGDNAVAVWSQWDASSLISIFSNNSSDGGSTWESSAQVLDSDSDYDAGEPQVAMSDAGVVAVWSQWDGFYNRACSNYVAFETVLVQGAGGEVTEVNKTNLLWPCLLVAAGGISLVRRKHRVS